MNNKSFACFILTHGRPDNCITYETLRRCGYTGKIYIIIDNEDKTADQYKQRYGDEVIVFDKEAIGKTFDLCDTKTDRRATVFARNASFDIAKQLGLEYYIQLDDDYTSFYYKSISDTGRITKTGHHALRATFIKQMDKVFDAMIELLNNTNACSIAMGQGGEFIGGSNAGLWKNGLRRKAMNSWLFKTDNPINFIGRMNDDVSTYVVHGSRGKLFFTISRLALVQLPTQKVAGGMTEMYLESGTYTKTMYSVMQAPSCVSVSKIGYASPRMHHHISTNNAYPKIISSKYCK